MMLNLPSLREVVTAYGLMAKKSLGQNFLLDQNITDKIIRLSLEAQRKTDFAGETVYEIGPGPGGLTRAILKANPDVCTVIEMDSRCIQIMQDIQNAGYTQLRIVEGDALQYNFVADDFAIKNIVSNLPYNISVPLLLQWLKNIEAYSSLTLMFQKEVAERITAEPNGKAYGRISVLAQLTCRIKTLMNLNPNCFTPAPKIWSTVLLFQPLENVPSTSLLQNVEKLTETAFGQRRKMIRQSLKSVPNLEHICTELNIDTTLRAENLTPRQYLALAERI
ncbi:MAG: 16S rRNA (adenine(1518)-N(6)/adenine(1519)-N(6))-dimethyltransferase RsmA [Alphaproteobacteria bacterium]|nr:16S rRNA (adenine(1518)-N(6)/adenine(1519)-N(6))-dimethyltransferase RsmA [Alphaproteobacteria bacterium]